MHKIFNICIKIFFNNYKHHITNNFKQLIKKKRELKNYLYYNNFNFDNK